VPNHYHPSAGKTRALFAELGFTEPDPDSRTGGYVFTRKRPDGRTQSVYAFHWSNFRIADEQGILRCRFALRLNLDASSDPAKAVDRARDGHHTYIAYAGKEQWDAVKATFIREYMTLLDAPYEEAAARIINDDFGDNGEHLAIP
jgi:hypothetical protein